ncbi:MAG: hypothetical protein EKK34_31260, partial [Mycobacterium sp.]
MRGDRRRPHRIRRDRAGRGHRPPGRRGRAAAGGLPHHPRRWGRAGCCPGPHPTERDAAQLYDPGGVRNAGRLAVEVNGKLDRRALPAPDYTPTTEAYVAPAGPVQEVLAGIFAQILGVERVAASDSFFELGGDSLSAMRLIAAATTTLNADVRVADLFEAPT